VGRQFSKWVADRFTGSADVPDYLKVLKSTAFKEVNAQLRGWASSQRGGARKNGGQRRSVSMGSNATTFSGLKGTKR